MGLFWARPQYQQPVIITQPGIAAPTVVYSSPVQPYGYGYGYDPLLAVEEVALVADIIDNDVIIVNNVYGGKKTKNIILKQKKIKKQSKKINKN
jgi:hypothetical protein